MGLRVWELGVIAGLRPWVCGCVAATPFRSAIDGIYDFDGKKENIPPKRDMGLT